MHGWGGGVIPRLSPEMANPEKPTARTRKVMATPLVWEKPTTSSKVASMPKPVAEHNDIHVRLTLLPVPLTPTRSRALGLLLQ